MTRRRTLAAALLALFVAGSSAPALAAPTARVDPSTERACVFLGSDPSDRQYVCVSFPWPL